MISPISVNAVSMHNSPLEGVSRNLQTARRLPVRIGPCPVRGLTSSQALVRRFLDITACGPWWPVFFCLGQIYFVFMKSVMTKSRLLTFLMMSWLSFSGYFYGIYKTYDIIIIIIIVSDWFTVNIVILISIAV